MQTEVKGISEDRLSVWLELRMLKPPTVTPTSPTVCI